MIVFTVLLSLMAVAYAAAARLLARADRRRPRSSPLPLRALPLRPAVPLAESIPGADRPAWTALDDLQLNRLLKDSS